MSWRGVDRGIEEVRVLGQSAALLPPLSLSILTFTSFHPQLPSLLSTRRFLICSLSKRLLPFDLHSSASIALRPPLSHAMTSTETVRQLIKTGEDNGTLRELTRLLCGMHDSY